jgi:pimeloyl-ACP methyl ester carboxylesterase
MNAFIFGFHPRGTSMERSLCEAGFEVWSVNLRHQGESRPTMPRAPGPSLRMWAEVDLMAATDAVAQRTRSKRDRVDLIGASLGGSISYAHLALRPEHRVGALVTIGSPLRWDVVPTLFRLAFASPRLVGMIPISGARRMAHTAFPMLAKVPRALDLYMNTSHVDLASAGELVRTIDDPHPRINRDIARWMQHRDLILRGVNVSHSLREVDQPLLVVRSNRDGIVPDENALAVLDLWGGDDVDTLQIGDDDEWYAHADLFISDGSPEHVFAPIAEWLLGRQ